jgi:hypothetical protein
MTSPQYQRLWGHRFRMQPDQNQKTRFDNLEGGQTGNDAAADHAAQRGQNWTPIWSAPQAVDSFMRLF